MLNDEDKITEYLVIAMEAEAGRKKARNLGDEVLEALFRAAKERAIEQIMILRSKL